MSVDGEVEQVIPSRAKPACAPAAASAATLTKPRGSEWQGAVLLSLCADSPVRALLQDDERQSFEALVVPRPAMERMT